ncbi:uncharacterized protein BDR25DRAFT_285369 [Lindgomyces ingoldianus]|uniref:Uncharacterized protein n=1 Tax=Lindgomyces ingoldianus TaxID=673940 RepID=A0ACB6QY27_9PLEO|nr:uncharacterized protein BDR25DRAFT_285369 [Lindgomyces ingoldianus]KAF2471765.1 hypothetical protein BDR25DRAFT_285369 [Lindgomyces ingoldianus]
MNSDAHPPHRVVPPSRRRDKPILSCTLCRRRKLKCDRQHPCKTCVDRGLSLSCSYAPSSASAKYESKASPNIHDRINQLERLVTTLMGPKENVQGISKKCSNMPDALPSNIGAFYSAIEPSPEADVPGTPDRVKLASDETRYTSSGHWTSILDGIAELKDQLDQIPTSAQPRDSDQGEIQGPDLLFGRQRHATRHELVSALPSRTETDELVNTYFESMDMAPTLIHRPTFLHEYAQFWEHPFETSVMWLGLLFGVLSVATRFNSVVDNYGDTADDELNVSLITAAMDSYRERLVQCLVLADYSKCPPFTIETLLLYYVSEYLRSRDTQFGTWILVGMIVRISFRMGYHRDPSRFPEISVFQGEMRRRMWAMIVQLDLMSSSQVGLPKMIQKSMYDTQEPRNLRDEDLDQNLTELPPSRPDTDNTAMLYALVRNRVIDVFGQIIDATSSTTQPAYQDIMQLDAALRDVFAQMPQSMKAIRAKDFEHVKEDSSMRRLYLGLTFLKAELMLHRPFLLLGRTDPRYEYSRLACLDAALEILEFQKILDSRPGAKIWSMKYRLWSISWRLSSLVNHDFLLATTVLALDLDRDMTSPLPVTSDDITNRVRFKTGQPTRVEIIKALTDAYGIWVHASRKSREAQKVAAAVRILLTKANADGALDPSNSAPVPPISYPDMLSPSQQFTNLLQQPGMKGWTDDVAGPAMHGIGNPHFVLPFPNAEVNPSMDLGGTFDWNAIESEFSFAGFEQDIQDYMG